MPKTTISNTIQPDWAAPQEQKEEVVDNEEQVNLSELIFSQSWEDPVADVNAFEGVRDKTVFCITSGGDNVLEFMRDRPGKVLSVDINPTQNYLLELKLSALRLNHGEFTDLLGTTACKPKRRSKLYQSIRHLLAPPARSFWDRRPALVEKGVIYSGKFEGYLRYVRIAMQLLQGSNMIEQLFEQGNMEDQKQFCQTRWDNGRIRLLFNMAFHPRIYPGGALKSDYFRFDDGTSTFAKSFHARFMHALRDLPAQSNYFLAMYLSGKYQANGERPAYLKTKNRDILLACKERLQLQALGAIEALEGQPESSIDCFALSNICEVMSVSESKRLFREVVRTARPDARICLRNLIVQREPKNARIAEIRELSDQLKFNERSFIYTKVGAYKVLA